MSGPWEKYAPTPEPSGPWQKYQAQPEQAPQDVKPESEMAPDISFGNRFAIKNFNSNPEDAVAYLKEQHPGGDFFANKGEIFQRKDGKVYPLDPNTGFFSKDIVMDALDLPSDVVSGLASTAAGAGAAALAAPATGGVGSIPAAMVASGGTNAGLEALKQKIGQYLGVNKQVDWGINNPDAVKIAGAAGAAAPLLFGTGATAANLAGKGLTADALQSAINSQRGVISMAATPALSLMSGIGRKAIDTLRAPGVLSKISALEKAPDAMTQIGESALGDVGAVNQALKDTGTIMNQARAGANTIPTEAAQNVIKSEISNLEQQAANEGLAPAQEVNLQELRDLLKQHLNTASMSPAKSLSVKQTLAAAAESPHLSPMAANAAERAVGALSATEKDVIPGLSELNPEYKSGKLFLEELGKASQNKNKSLNFLRTLGGPSKGGLAEDVLKADQDYGTDLTGKAALLNAFNTFRKSRSFEIMSREGAHRGATGALGTYLGWHEGGAPGAVLGAGLGAGLGSPAAVRGAIGLLNAAPYARPTTLPIWNLIQDQYFNNKGNQ